MARITIRLEDDLHDQLLYRAARAGMPCASMIRLMLRKLALPETTFRMLRTPGEELLVTVLQMRELIHADLARRSPETLELAMDCAKAVLRDHGLLEEG